MYEQGVQKRPLFAEKLRWLIIGRLIASVFLLLTSALWLHGNLSVTYRSFWDGTLPIFIAVAIASVLYSFALKYNDNHQTQAVIQLAFDIWITTWLVWTTGDVRSPYIIDAILANSAKTIEAERRAKETRTEFFEKRDKAFLNQIDVRYPSVVLVVCLGIPYP